MREWKSDDLEEKIRKRMPSVNRYLIRNRRERTMRRRPRDKDEQNILDLLCKRKWEEDLARGRVKIINKRADEDRVIKIYLPSGRHLYVIGIEDIILDRLRACVHCQSSSDCEWGLRMLKVHYDSLDLDYIRLTAQDDLISDRLSKWLAELV